MVVSTSDASLEPIPNATLEPHDASTKDQSLSQDRISLPTPPSSSSNGTKMKTDPFTLTLRAFGPLVGADSSGKTWIFPWSLCCTWQGMHTLMTQAFKAHPRALDHVEKCAFELLDPSNCVILTELWESLAKPGWLVTIVFNWSADNPPPPPHLPLASPPIYPAPGLVPPPLPPLGLSLPPRKVGKEREKRAGIVTGPPPPGPMPIMPGSDRQYRASHSSSDSEQSESEYQQIDDSVAKFYPDFSQEHGAHADSIKDTSVRKHDLKAAVRTVVEFWTAKKSPHSVERYLYAQHIIGPIAFTTPETKPRKVPILEEKFKISSPRKSEKHSYVVPPPPGLPGGGITFQQANEVPPSSGSIKLDRGDKLIKRTLTINSPLLLNALRAIIKYSSMPPSGDDDSLKSGVFPFPYGDLVHHKHDLLNYKASHPARERHSEAENRECDRHIDILVSWLDGQPDIGLKEAEEKWTKTYPTTTFGSFWILMKPGTDVYVHEFGQLNAYMVESVETAKTVYGNIQPYEVEVWNLAFDGELISRNCQTITVPVFDGEREITSLPVYPVRFHRDPSGQQPLKEQLIERGKKYVELVRGPAFREYSDQRHDSSDSKSYQRARVVVVQKSRFEEISGFKSSRKRHQRSQNALPPPPPGPLPPPPNAVPLSGAGARARIAVCPCDKCEKYAAENHIYVPITHASYDYLDPWKGSFNDHQYSLCDMHLDAFVLKDRVYDRVDVAGISLPIMNTRAIDSLVMKIESNKDLLKAICKSYRTTADHQKPFSADFIQGKGEGQIILLHGPPGTGKTLTAESIAEYTYRPLLSITAADLGHVPKLLEMNLLRFFKDARDWGAIVVLDEADVYLERRDHHDLERNSIVSVFLRAMDYFEGILILTTNRVGSFDEAFMSRIHVQIGYDTLDDEARSKIWEGYFRKLKEDYEETGREIKHEWDAKEYVQRSAEVRSLHWNGREIRNGFQTAVTLALDDAKDGSVPMVKESHLRKVVGMSNAFKQYIKSTHEDMDDSEMAFRSGLRDDGKRHDR